MALIGIKTVTITEKGQIALPKDIRQKGKGFESGSKITILAYEDRVELRPLKGFENLSKGKDITAALLSEKSLAKTWLTKEEDKAWQNL